MKSYSVALRCGSFTFEWLLFKKLKNLFSKKQRKHFPCFYTVVWTRVEVWEDEILQWEDVCFYNVWENDKNIFYFFYKITPRKLKRGNSLLYYIDASVLRNRSNTRKSVSSGYPNPQKCVEKRGGRPSFFNNFEVFGYPDETLFRVFDLASQTNQYLKRKFRSKLA